MPLTIPFDYKVRFNKKNIKFEIFKMVPKVNPLADKLILVESVVFSEENFDKFTNELERIAELGLKDALRKLRFQAALEAPYPQHCLCQHYPTHIANDCHEHNVNPMHYFHDLEFQCICEQKA